MTGGQKSLGVLLQEKGYEDEYGDFVIEQEKAKEAVVLWLTQKPLIQKEEVQELAKPLGRLNPSYVLGFQAGWNYMKKKLLADVKKEASV